MTGTSDDSWQKLDGEDSEFVQQNINNNANLGLQLSLMSEDVDQRSKAPQSQVLSRSQCTVLVVWCISASLLSLVFITVYFTQSQWKKARYSSITVNETIEALENKRLSPDAHLLWNNVRLPRAIKPTLYHLYLTIDRNIETFSGSVQISFDSYENTNYILLNMGQSLSVKDSVISVKNVYNHTVPIRRQFYVQKTRYLVIQLATPLGATSGYMLHIMQFQGIYSKHLKGLFKSKYTREDGTVSTFVASQLQPNFAQLMFPCFDEPDLKAVFILTVYHQSAIALSNMPVKKTTVDPITKLTRVQFHATPLMPTYLLALVVGDFKGRHQILPKEFSVGVYAQPSKLVHADFAIKYAVKVQEYFTNYFSFPMTQPPKADHVALPDHFALAMENWGLVTYVESRLLFNPSLNSFLDKFKIALVVAHEVAHSWFGNLVTLRWWNDLWLNEGFASLLMFVAMNEIYPEWHVNDLKEVRYGLSVRAADSLPTTHPVLMKVLSADDALQAFDRISYDKGMAMVSMLRSVVGPVRFRTALQQFVDRYQYSNAAMDDIWREFDRHIDLKLPVSDFMNSWITQPGYPVITLSKTSDGYIFTQKRFVLNDNFTSTQSIKRDILWNVALTYRLNLGTRIKTVWLTSKTVKLLTSANDWIVVNPDKSGFYRVNYNEATWLKIIEELRKNHRQFAKETRAMFIDDSFNLARAGELSYNIPLKLSLYLSEETEYLPWYTFAESVQFLETITAETNLFGKIQTYVSRLATSHIDQLDYRQLSNATLPDLLLRQLWLKLGAQFSLKKPSEFIHSQFAAWKTYNQQIPADFKTTVLSAAMVRASAEDWNFLYQEFLKTPNSQERQHYLEALVKTKIPWLVFRLLQEGLHRKLGVVEFRHLFRSLVQSATGRLIAFYFYTSRFNDIQATFSDQPFLFRDIIRSVEHTSRQSQLDSILQLHKKYPLTSSITKIITETVGIIRTNIVWVNTNLNSFRKHLSSVIG